MRRKKVLLSILLALGLMLSGCGTAAPPKSAAPAQEKEAPAAPRGNLAPYKAPPMASAAFHPELAEGSSGVSLDLSAVGEGYVAVSARSDRRLKFQVLKDGNTYTYNLSSEGVPSVFPLQCGDGRYTFRVMENVTENNYAQMYLTECDVTLLDEFQPFLRPSDYSSYSGDSECVRKAAELASGCSGALEVVGAVYSYICRTVSYDSDKAATVKSGYLPVPDETMRTGKGICFDYASLAAAMLRSQGIPTKIIFGYVAPNDLYHAWNMIYTEESGWVTVSFEVNGKSWNRVDLTFSAGGADTKFIGNGSNYTDVYFY